MKRLLFFVSVVCVMFSSCADSELEVKLKSVMADAAVRYAASADMVEKSRKAYPCGFADGEYVLAEGELAWSAGYYPGCLWLLAQECQNEELKEYADVLTYRYVQPESLSMYGAATVVNVAHNNGFNTTKNPRYESAVGTVARLLPDINFEAYHTVKKQEGDLDSYQRVSVDCLPAIGCFYNYGWRTNMINHGKELIKHLSREDGAMCEGAVLQCLRKTYVDRFAIYGLGKESAWARGQAWALYGFTMLYRQTEEPEFLAQSKKLADFIIKNLPEDGVPNWDFDAEQQKKDSSAAAIMASAFVELYGLTGDKNYLQVAELQLATLSSEEYLAKADECGGMLLKHGVDNLPQGRLVDASLTYGDYYFIEAIIRYLNR